MLAEILKFLFTKENMEILKNKKYFLFKFRRKVKVKKKKLK